mmetsp:Transcript_2915/g.8184  ORF Transcript_2915/g.8184 Transcript_2915/m.8184 type:complete len:222 (-) Transcript_2915:877-1542(-)
MIPCCESIPPSHFGWAVPFLHSEAGTRDGNDAGRRPTFLIVPRENSPPNRFRRTRMRSARTCQRCCSSCGRRSLPKTASAAERSSCQMRCPQSAVDSIHAGRLLGALPASPWHAWTPLKLTSRHWPCYYWNRTIDLAGSTLAASTALVSVSSSLVAVPSAVGCADDNLTAGHGGVKMAAALPAEQRALPRSTGRFHAHSPRLGCDCCGRWPACRAMQRQQP